MPEKDKADESPEAVKKAFAEWLKSDKHVCPHCGRCPVCGRGGEPNTDTYPYPDWLQLIW